MEKLIYLVWERPSRDGAELRGTVLDDVVGELRTLAELRGLALDLDDDGATLSASVPVPDAELPVRVVVSVWLETLDQRGPVEAIVGRLGIRRAGYLVTESLCADYGSNQWHPAPRDWPAGTRSPGISTVTVFDRNPRLSVEAFHDHWYLHQSTMSEWMQPRARYVRNAVVRPVTRGAPPYAAIVEEAWPSDAHVADPNLAFGTADPAAMAENIRIMLDSVTLLADFPTLRTYTMSEYLF